jgi:hypothetical protein
MKSKVLKDIDWKIKHSSVAKRGQLLSPEKASLKQDIGGLDNSPECSSSDLDLSAVHLASSAALLSEDLRPPVRRFVTPAFRCSAVSRDRCRSAMSSYVITLGPPTTVERTEARDVFSLFCSISHWFSADKIAQ